MERLNKGARELREELRLSAVVIRQLGDKLEVAREIICTDRCKQVGFRKRHDGECEAIEKMLNELQPLIEKMDEYREGFQA